MKLESDEGQPMGRGADSPRTRDMTLESDGFGTLIVCLEMWAVWCPLAVCSLIALSQWKLCCLRAGSGFTRHRVLGHLSVHRAIACGARRVFAFDLQTANLHNTPGVNIPGVLCRFAVWSLYVKRSACDLHLTRAPAAYALTS